MPPVPDGGLDESLAATLLPERDARGHKGTFGHVVAVAGSVDFAGAALLAGTAALRVGCGLVTLCVPATVQPLIAGRVPELITRGLPEAASGEVDGRAGVELIAEMTHDALLLGPGLRPDRGTSKLVMTLLDTPGSLAVLDAGALDVLAGAPGWWRRLERSSVLTSHPGEFRRLGAEPGSSDDERRDAALAAAYRWSQVVVLKGAHTVVADGDGRSLVAPFELPALATAGTGDVLAGIIASFVAQGLEAFDAAAAGVYLHGAAGEAVSERLGDAGVLASDLLTQLPRTRRHLDSLRRRNAAGRLGFEAPGSAAS